MIRNFITSFTLVAFVTTTCLFPTITYAQENEPTEETEVTLTEKVTTLKLGDPAPFAGTLFSIPAAAKILADLEFTQQQCNLEIDRRLSLQASEFKLQLDIKQAAFDSLQTKHTELMVIRDQQVEYLTQNYKSPKWYESGEFWFAIGLIAGIGVTVGAGYAIGQAN